MKAPTLALLLAGCGAAPLAPASAVEIAPATGPTAPPPAPPEDPRIRRVSPGVYEVQASLFEALIEAPQRVAPRAWLEATSEEERLVGYRLGGVTPGGILARLGLLEDDLIQIVNGESLRTEEAIRAARASARRTAQVTVVLRRNGLQELFLYRLVYR